MIYWFIYLNPEEIKAKTNRTKEFFTTIEKLLSLMNTAVNVLHIFAVLLHRSR